MPKARHSSYDMAFKPKIVAEAEAVDNSEIARKYGLSEVHGPPLAKGSGQTFQPQIENVSKVDNDGSLHSKVS